MVVERILDAESPRHFAILRVLSRFELPCEASRSLATALILGDRSKLRLLLHWLSMQSSTLMHSKKISRTLK